MRDDDHMFRVTPHSRPPSDRLYIGILYGALGTCCLYAVALAVVVWATL